MKCNPNCKTCSKIDKCTSCKDGLQLFQNGDCDICGDGNVLYNSYCRKCYENCKTCYDTTNTGCITCIDPLILLPDGSCSSKCPVGYYEF